MTQDMIRQIEAQHRTLLGLLDAVDTAPDTDHAFHLLRQIAGLLVRHAPLEEALARGRVQASDPGRDTWWSSAMASRSQEHRRLNHLILDVLTRTGQDPGSAGELAEVTQEVRSHVVTEARVLLPVLRDPIGGARHLSEATVVTLPELATHEGQPRRVP